MYRGFKLPELSFNNENEYYEIGNTLFNALEKLAQESLKYYISTDGVLDGNYTCWISKKKFWYYFFY